MYPCHIESLWAVPLQPTVLVRTQFANAQDKLHSNLNSYAEMLHLPRPEAARVTQQASLVSIHHILTAAVGSGSVSDFHKSRWPGS